MNDQASKPFARFLIGELARSIHGSGRGMGLPILCAPETSCCNIHRAPQTQILVPRITRATDSCCRLVMFHCSKFDSVRYPQITNMKKAMLLKAPACSNQTTMATAARTALTTALLRYLPPSACICAKRTAPVSRFMGKYYSERRHTGGILAFIAAARFYCKRRFMCKPLRYGHFDSCRGDIPDSP